MSILAIDRSITAGDIWGVLNVCTDCIDTVTPSLSLSSRGPSFGLNLTWVANGLAGAEGLRKRRLPRWPRVEEKKSTRAPTRGVDEVVSEQHIFGVVVEGLG